MNQISGKMKKNTFVDGYGTGQWAGGRLTERNNFD